MAVDTITRNLRDGEMVVSDGTSTPVSLTLTLDEGDISWTESEEAVQILDRGVLSQVREGDEVPVEISYSLKWVHLIGKSVTGSGDAAQFYEMINNTSNTYSSTRAAGEKYCLKHTFTVTAPAAAANTSETIAFAYVFKNSLEMGEGDDANLISFSGTDYETVPTITRS